MDIKSSVNVWELRRISGAQMPKEELFKAYEAFVTSRANCALATGYGTYVRNTPMRYSYRAGKFYLLTEGGYKFRGLVANSNVCLAIYDSGDTDSDTRGITVEGTATVSEYSQDSKQTSPYYMISVSPTIVDILNPDFEKSGYYRLQRLTL